MPGRVYSREFKVSVVRQIVSGEKRPAQVCREYSPAESVLARWRKEYEERGEVAFGPRQADEARPLEQQIAELERFCGQLALENRILRKALQSAPSRSATP
jgi:putative transposase